MSPTEFTALAQLMVDLYDFTLVQENPVTVSKGKIFVRRAQLINILLEESPKFADVVIYTPSSNGVPRRTVTFISHVEDLLEIARATSAVAKMIERCFVPKYNAALFLYKHGGPVQLSLYDGGNLIEKALVRGGLFLTAAAYLWSLLEWNND